MERQMLDLKWLHFPKHLAEWSSKLLMDESSQDIWIKCNDGIIGAHKIVLSSCSTWFRDSSQDFYWAPHFKPLLVLWDTRLEEMRLILEYMYLGEVQVDERRLLKFLDLASKLKVKGLLLGKENSHGNKDSSREKNSYEESEMDLNDSSIKPDPSAMSSRLDEQTIAYEDASNLRSMLPPEETSRGEFILPASETDEDFKKTDIKNINFEKRSTANSPQTSTDLKLKVSRIKSTSKKWNEWKVKNLEVDTTKIGPIPVVLKSSNEEDLENIDSYETDSNFNKDTRSTTVKCTECGKSLLAQSLKAHMDNVHSGRTFNCDTCDKTFSSLKTWKQHKKRSRCVVTEQDPNSSL